jgi:WD40 repeat protein
MRHVGLSNFALTSNSKTAITLGSDMTIRHWDLESGRPIKSVSLQTNHPSIWRSLSPNGQFAASCEGGNLIIWDTTTGRELKRFRQPVADNDLAFLWFSPDGRNIAVGSWEPASVIIDCQSGEQRTLAMTPRKIGRDSTLHAHFSADGKWFVAGGGSESALCVWETATWRKVHELICDASISATSPDSRRLIVNSIRPGGAKVDLRVFDLLTGQETLSVQLEQYHYSLAVSPNSKMVACGRSDYSIVFDLETGRVVHRLTGRPLDVAFTPDGKSLVSHSGNVLRIWDVATGKEKFELSPDMGHPPLATAVSPDGQSLATACWLDQSVLVWDLNKGVTVQSLPIGRLGQERFTRDLAFSRDGRVLSCALANGFFQYWMVAPMRELRRLDLYDSGRPQPVRLYFYRLHVSGDNARITTLERGFSQPESTRLAIWDADTGQLIDQQSLPIERTDWSWAGDDSAFVTALADGLAVYESDSFRVRHRIKDGSPKLPVAASPSGRLIAAAKTVDGKGAIGVWDADTAQSIATVAIERPDHLSFTADNRMLVVASDKVLHVWDLAIGKERGRRALPTGTTGLVLTPDGRRAITPLKDGTALVWDLSLDSGEPLSVSADEKQISTWWNELASDEAVRAHAAAWRLAELPSKTIVPFLSRHLRAQAVDSEAVQRAVADLDNNSFAIRERAGNQLEQMGSSIVPALRGSITTATSAEVRRRLEGVIERLLKPTQNKSPDELRRLRAITVAEQAGGADATRLLREIGEAPMFLSEGRAAKAAVARLEAKIGAQGARNP